MVSSVGIQPCTINISSNLLRKANSIFPRLQTPSFSLNPTSVEPKQKPIKISGLATCLIQETSISDNKNETTEKLGVVVKPIERPRLVLKFIWMEKNLGIAIDQVIIGGNGTIPLSPYYFWPRKDAWEELRLILESKPWISQKQMVILLNQATDIINLWQQTQN